MIVHINKQTDLHFMYKDTVETINLWKEDDISAIICEFDDFKRQIDWSFQGKWISVLCIIAVLKTAISNHNLSFTVVFPFHRLNKDGNNNC